MPLVNTTEMFKKAYEGGYAIGAFNINNMEIVQGVVAACKKHNAPVILQVSASARKYAHHDYLLAMVKAAEKETGLPIALHLDHGPNFETCKECVDGGFTSVMIDGSSLPYEENIAVTKKVVDYAHKFGVTVEGELGQLAGVEDEVSVSAEDASYTKPEQVQDFYPTPGTLSTAMFYTELDPMTMEPVYVPKTAKEKAMQRALLQYTNPKNEPLVREALTIAGRKDLIPIFIRRKNFSKTYDLTKKKHK